MKGSCTECRFCQSNDLKVNRANETIQCEGCDRILEERCNDFRVMGVNLERDSPYCVVTQDKALTRYKFPPGLDGDPFHATGLITVFSHMSIQQQGAFTLTARTFPGDFAELERLLQELDIEITHSTAHGNKLLKRVLAVYMTLLDVSEMLDLPRDQVDDSLRKFKQYVDSGAPVRRKDVQVLGAAALVTVMQREVGKSRDWHACYKELQTTIAVVSVASGQDQKEVSEAVKNMLTLVDISTPAQSANQSIASHMPEFCRQLGMQRSAEQLAVTIGENAISKAVCTRRNPTSIAAAAIYLACNLEDQKKTQTEICRVTGLTEVTLRKVYKELLTQHEKLIPSNYVSKVRLQTLIPVTPGGLVGRPPASVPTAKGKAGFSYGAGGTTELSSPAQGPSAASVLGGAAGGAAGAAGGGGSALDTLVGLLVQNGTFPATEGAGAGGGFAGAAAQSPAASTSAAGVLASPGILSPNSLVGNPLPKPGTT